MKFCTKSEKAVFKNVFLNERKRRQRKNIVLYICLQFPDFYSGARIKSKNYCSNQYFNVSNISYSGIKPNF